MKSSDLINLLVPAEDRLVESLGGPGLYYIIPMPSSSGPIWELVAFSFDEYGEDSGHTELWVECLPAIMASRWSRRIKRKAVEIEDVLLDLDHAFPRGRITSRLSHLHGNDASAVGWSLDRIERRFGLDGKCRHEIDQHEMCEVDQRDAARALLGIETIWPAA